MASPDWSRPFEAAYRFMRVSRATGRELGTLANVRYGGSVTLNQDSQTYESASLPFVGSLDVGSDLVRAYLVATWPDGASAEVMLGTWVCSTPSVSRDGRVSTGTADLYGRLREVADDDWDTPVSVASGSDTVAQAAAMAGSRGLAVVADPSTHAMTATWLFGVGQDGDGQGSVLAAINRLLEVAGFQSARTTSNGTVELRRYASPDAKPVSATLAEGPRSTLLSDVTDELDSFEVANVVHVDCSTQDADVRGTAVDDDPASSWSTASVGRRIVKTYTMDDLPEGTTTAQAQASADARAAELLASTRSVAHTVTVRHPFDPSFGVGDVVALDYPTAGLSGRFLVRKRTIQLGAGCLCTDELREFVR